MQRESQYTRMEIKICPVCGKKFPCYLSDECWCAKFPKISKDPVKDCLCADCLKKEALKQGYKEKEIPERTEEKIVLITAEEINGNCPVFNIGDIILIKNGEVDLQNSDAFCIHAAHVLLYYALPIREGIKPVTLGLATKGDKAFVRCPDPGPPQTHGGTVTFSLEKIG